MSQIFSEMSRAKRSLETVRNSKRLLPSFYSKKIEKGDRVVWCMHGVPTELLVAFDLTPMWPENFGTLCAARLVAPKFIEIAEAEGYSTDLCSYLTNSMGYCKSCVELGTVPPDSPLEGGLGEPIMLLGSSYLCEPRYKWFQSIATRYFDVPVFSSDPISPAIDIDIDDARIIEHYMEPLREDLKAQVAFLERHTGKTLDVDRFRNIMETSQKSLDYWYEVLELRKSKPCPMGAEDYFSCIIPQLFMLGTEEAFNFYETLYNEVRERVQNGEGVISEEKYRLFFAGIPPWYNLGMFNYIESLGAIVVFESTYYPGPPVEIDLDDPVEGLAERIWKKACWYHRTGAESMPEMCDPGIMVGVGRKYLVQMVKEYGIDGALLHRTRSCRAVSWGQIHYQNILEKEGIPSLLFESDMADARAWSDSRIKAQIEPFLETVDQVLTNRVETRG